MNIQKLFPYMCDVDDYHSFKYLANEFSLLLNIKVKYIELGNKGRCYGYFYIGKKPTKQTLDTVCKKTYFISFKELKESFDQ